MPDAPAHIEQAELQQLMRWLTDIEEAVQSIDKNTEDYDSMDQCRRIRKILNKMRGFLITIRD
jgi:hypothetical protein